MFIYTEAFSFFVHETAQGGCGFNTTDDHSVDVINDSGRCPVCHDELAQATEVTGKIEMWRAA